MSKESFFKWLYDQPLADRIVLIRYKYQFETKWICSTEVLIVNLEDNPNNHYTWLNDWYEGQEDIEVLGCQKIDSIDIASIWN